MKCTLCHWTGPCSEFGRRFVKERHTRHSITLRAGSKFWRWYFLFKLLLWHVSFLNSSPFYCCILLLFDVFKTWGTNNESVAYLAIGCSVLNVVWVSEYFENRKLDREHGNFLDLPSGILSPKGIKWHNGGARLTPKLILIGNDFKKIRPLDWWKSVKPLLRFCNHQADVSHHMPSHCRTPCQNSSKDESLDKPLRRTFLSERSYKIWKMLHDIGMTHCAHWQFTRVSIKNQN